MVCEVLKFVLPDDLESFAHTTRRVLALSQPFLKEHREWLSLYTTFSSYPPPGQERHTEERDGFSVGPVPNLFRDVLSEPRISDYIREVKLATPLTLNYEIVWNNYAKARTSYEKQVGLINTAIAQTDVFTIREQYNFAKDNGLDGCRDGEFLLIALLLPLLSNLNSLSVEWDAIQCALFSCIIKGGAFFGFPWLANLAIVRLINPDGRRSLCLSDLQLFNSLPALKSLTAFNVDSDEMTWASPDSHTTELKLLKPYVPSWLLQNYLQSFRNLQSFALEYDRPWHPTLIYGDAFEPHWIRKALLASAKTTLQTLTLLGVTLHSIFPDHFMGSLQEFETLREIHTEWRYLIPMECDLETQPSRVLPAALLRLLLRDYSIPSVLVFERYRAFFRGIRRAKAENCLHMEDVGVRNVMNSDERYKWGAHWSAGEQGVFHLQRYN